MKTYSVRLPEDLKQKTRALKKKTGISEAALIANAVAAGLPAVEAGLKKFAPEVCASHTEAYQPKTKNKK
jgi:predicted DNA-binding protein